MINILTDLGNCAEQWSRLGGYHKVAIQPDKGDILPAAAKPVIGLVMGMFGLGVALIEVIAGVVGIILLAIPAALCYAPAQTWFIKAGQMFCVGGGMLVIYPVALIFGHTVGWVFCGCVTPSPEQN